MATLEPERERNPKPVEDRESERERDGEESVEALDPSMI